MSLSLIQEASQCWDNMVAFKKQLSVSPVRWDGLKYLLREEQKWVTYFLAICIQKASYEPVPLAARYSKMLQSPLPHEGPAYAPSSPGPSPSPTDGASPLGLDSTAIIFKTLISWL